MYTQYTLYYMYMSLIPQWNYERCVTFPIADEQQLVNASQLRRNDDVPGVGVEMISWWNMRLCGNS